VIEAIRHRALSTSARRSRVIGDRASGRRQRAGSSALTAAVILAPFIAPPCIWCSCLDPS
jgi:hypothetical protein